MPRSHSSSSREEVLAKLRGDLPAAKLLGIPTGTDGEYLDVLETASLVAGFAFSNGDAGASYMRLYPAFKKCYAENESKWDKRDVAFVLCVSADGADLVGLSSRVETDTFFCRKFVIPLRPPIQLALSRLPFLPLVAIGADPLRPPSAQTLLQRAGLRPELAEWLARQGSRSAGRIVEECVDGRFGPPTFAPLSAGTEVARPIGGRSAVRVERIEIENFRAYRTSQSFELGDRVTILYGPNGFGKTSFFDAFDFVATGGIGRLERRKFDLERAARNLDAGSAEGSVGLVFTEGGVTRKVVRRVSRPNAPELDGVQTSRKAVLAAITGNGGSEQPTDRIDNFVRMFRASHLFNFEYQELTRDFREDCRLPSDVVSRMLALEDYENAVNKTEDVVRQIRKVVADAEGTAEELRCRGSAKQLELDRLGRVATGQSGLEALEVRFHQLRDEMRKLGVEDGEALGVSVLRGWRAQLVAMSAELRTRFGKLAAVRAELQWCTQGAKESATLERRTAELARTLEASAARHSTLREALERARQTTKSLEARGAELRARLDAVAWVVRAQPKLRECSMRLEALEDLDARERAELSRLSTEEREATAAVAAATQAQHGLDSQLNLARSRVASIQGLQSLLAEEGARRDALRDASSTMARTMAEQQSLLRTIVELESTLASITRSETRLDREIREEARSLSEVEQLVSELAQHVRTGECLACGQDHGSRESLIARMRDRRPRESTYARARELDGVRLRIGEVRQALAASAETRAELDDRIAKVQVQLRTLQGDAEAFADRLRELGVDGGADLAVVQAQLGEMHKAAEVLLERLSRECGVSVAGVARLRDSLAGIQEAARARRGAATERAASLAALREEREGLLRDPRARAASLESATEALEQARMQVQTDLQVVATEAGMAEEAVSKSRESIGAVARQIDEVTTNLTAGRARLAALAKRMAEVHATLDSLQLPRDVTDDAVAIAVADAMREAQRIERLRDAAQSLESAVDVATTAAALTSGQNEVRLMEAEAAKAQRLRDEHLPWQTFFERVATHLNAHRDSAIDNFTREYGPRTSVIQRRLRSVYGFDDLEVSSSESEIVVRVRKGDLVLPPTDFFSQSQQQILFLGLFLTASLAQTWSGFGPVLLDDPVTNFDDLNTYAFIDLVDGLISDERQFVIATCDERLLQIARHKFQHLGPSAKFYVFSGIGADGPVVRALTGGTGSTSTRADTAG